VIEVDEPVQVVAHDPAWRGLGAELVQQISDQLTTVAVHADITHIGSTAVPGLAAKPIIDIQVGCAMADTGLVVARMRHIGFEHLGQTGDPGREYLRRRAGQPVNIAIVELGGRLWADNIMFRDYLRAYPDSAARYERAKRRAAEEAGALRAYSALKAAIVSEIIDKAHVALGRARS